MKFTLGSGRTFPPSESEGWTVHFIERETRYWVDAQVGPKTHELFKNGTLKAWQWAEAATLTRWFTDGERLYGIELWKLASVSFKLKDTPPITDTVKYGEKD